MLRREIELVKALNQKLEARLTRHRQAVRALKRKNETMRKMHGSFDLKRLIDDLLALALHVCDSENVSMIPIDDDADELDFIEVIGKPGSSYSIIASQSIREASDLWSKPGQPYWQATSTTHPGGRRKSIRFSGSALTH